MVTNAIRSQRIPQIRQLWLKLIRKIKALWKDGLRIKLLNVVSFELSAGIFDVKSLVIEIFDTLAK